MKSEHENFQVKNCGTFMNKEYPFLHATPNFLCSCDCCGLGCGEVKCPFCIDSLDFESYVLKKSSCLEKIESDFILKKDHDYYHQVQQQLYTTKHKGRTIIFLTGGGTIFQRLGHNFFQILA